VSCYRNNFADATAEAKRVCGVWVVEAVFRDKRVEKTRRHFDELSQDSRLADPEDHFRVSVYANIMSTL